MQHRGQMPRHNRVELLEMSIVTAIGSWKIPVPLKIARTHPSQLRHDLQASISIVIVSQK